MPFKKKVKSVAEEVLKDDAKPKRGRKYEPKWGPLPEEPAPEPEAVESEPEAETLDGKPPHEPPVKKGKGIPSRQRKNLSTYTTDGDLVDIWERRILNPDAHESVPIRIRTPGMRIRWINLSNRGRFQRARYEQGWVPVHKSELLDEREIGGMTVTSEGYVCRGEKQGEMLMKIPQAVFRKIQERRAELNKASYKKLRESMGSAGSKHFGDKYDSQAGDQAAEAASKFVGSVKFGNEKVSTDELFE